jgi:hypothetical protein
VIFDFAKSQNTGGAGFLLFGSLLLFCRKIQIFITLPYIGL